MEIEQRDRKKNVILRQDSRGGLAVLVSLVLFFVCVISASFAVRTQGVLGPWVSGKIAEEASKRDLSIYVHALSPAGLTGLRLHGVHGEGVIRGRRFSFEAQDVDVYPSLVGLVRGRGVPAEILVHKGYMHVGGKEEGIREDEHGGQLVSSSDRTSLAQDLEIACVECFVEFEEAPLSTGLPLSVPGVQLDHFALTLRAWELDTLDGLVRVGSGQPFRMSLSEKGEGGDERGDHRRMLRVDTLRVDGEAIDTRDFGLLPPQGGSAHFRSAALDWDELLARRLDLSLQDLVIEAGDNFPLVVRMRELALMLDGDDFQISTPKGTLWALDGRRSLGELEAVNLEITEARTLLKGKVVFLDRDGGRADVAMQWDRTRQLVRFELWFADFDGAVFVRSLPEDLPLKRLRLGGAITGEVGLDDGIIHLSSGLELRDLTLNLPFLATEALIFEKMGLAGKTLIHLPSRSVSVTEGKVRFGSASPVTFDALAVNTEPGWSFSGMMKGERIEAARLLESLPQAMTGALREAQLEGAFDLALKTSGMTAYPDSLVLDVSFGGDVNVTRDGQYIDVRALGSGAVPAFDSDSHRARRINAAQWVSYDALPPHIPHALLSAEDAAFFKHSGLDWVGLRMAMIHNLREGNFERGGSTISQQLAKNLFLTPNRTLSRKLQEAFLTWRIEAELDKERILELYLNVVEWGPEIHGINRAAYYYFGVHPAELEPVEMVLLAAILPSPVRFGDAIKLGYLPSSRQGKMERTLVNMRFLEQLSWNEYYRAQGALARRQIGRIELRPCADDDTAPAEAPACADVITSDDEDMRFEAWEVVDIPVDTGWIPIHP